MSNPYSYDKVRYHPSHLESIRQGMSAAPIHVQLIPTNVCNQRCSFCSYRQPGYTSNQTFDHRESIPWEKMVEIVDDCESMGVRAIQLTGGGEPSCHPKFLDLCQMILDSEIDLAVVSNGSLWTNHHVDVLQRAKWLRISVDAGDAAAYSTLRGTSINTYNRVWDTISTICDCHPRPVVGVGYVMTKDNWRGASTAVAKARECGVDNVRISAVFQNDGAGYFDDFGDRASKMCQDLARQSTPGFQVINLFNDRLKDLGRGRPDYRECGFSRFCTYIGADQKVYRCCVYAYNELGLLGDLRGQSFRRLWFSDDVQQDLQEFDAMQCERCMFNEKNRSIQNAIDDGIVPEETPPDHVNFI